jgi:hypothetical protein
MKSNAVRRENHEPPRHTMGLLGWPVPSDGFGPTPVLANSYRLSLRMYTEPVRKQQGLPIRGYWIMAGVFSLKVNLNWYLGSLTTQTASPLNHRA